MLSSKEKRENSSIRRMCEGSMLTIATRSLCMLKEKLHYKRKKGNEKQERMEQKMSKRKRLFCRFFAGKKASTSSGDHKADDKNDIDEYGPQGYNSGLHRAVFSGICFLETFSKTTNGNLYLKHKASCACG
ncbi:uncharacterized protein LOC111488432 isoform X2 [Cucurbita maxima]|uniref:Uncharacterized protein LOC111488432 isoform X2 n=1 Tax=Cucurbita maxima TaxID=3661 RepID=A0A6J1JUB6_CUCMA|nr:uncharacterized protein LOC111488432 isoform X2 [Cucurbita maxima]